MLRACYLYFQEWEECQGTFSSVEYSLPSGVTMRGNTTTTQTDMTATQFAIPRFILLAFLAFMVLSVSWVNAVALFPDVCDSLSTPNGVYNMTKNLTASSGTCITIAANNVTLDCKGFTINYAPSANGFGVDINSYNLTTVKNCIITQVNPAESDAPGIYLNASIGSLILNNTITVSGSGFTSYGIILEGTNSSSVVSNRINIAYQLLQDLVQKSTKYPPAIESGLHFL